MPKLLPPKATPHLIEIERLRRAIPVSAYLTLMHSAVMTGCLPILDLNGQPTGEFQKLEAKERMATMHKLVDKAMPDRVEAPMLPEDNKALTIDVRNLSIEELENLANATSPLNLSLQEPGNEGPGPGAPGAAVPEAGAAGSEPSGDDRAAAPGRDG